MTISVTVSVNGNYKCPVSYKQGGQEVNQVISGHGHAGPCILHIPFHHGPDVLTLRVGPEEADHGSGPQTFEESPPPIPPTAPDPVGP